MNFINIYNNEPPIEPTEDQNNHKYYKFLQYHPLHKTHYVYCVSEKYAKIPNFLGGSLPRHDSGDREFYCSTMLTLFIPWRTGSDLKTEEQS